MEEYKITYFPMEQKYSIWDKSHNLIKEWFDSREDAQKWIDENLSPYKRLEVSGGNFTKLQFKTVEDLKQYLEDNKEMFRYVGVAINWDDLIIVF